MGNRACYQAVLKDSGQFRRGVLFAYFGSLKHTAVLHVTAAVIPSSYWSCISCLRPGGGVPVAASLAQADQPLVAKSIVDKHQRPQALESE